MAGSAAMCGERARKAAALRVRTVALSVEGELAVGVEEGLEQPVAEEAGAAGDEEAGVAECGEDGACVCVRMWARSSRGREQEVMQGIVCIGGGGSGGILQPFFR